MGIFWFDYLAWNYFTQLEASSPVAPLLPAAPSDSICDEYPTFCAMSSTSDAAFVLSVAGWATLQLVWTLVLLAGQLWQIARQMTTLEVSNLGRFGFMGGRGGSSLAMQQGHQHSSAQDGVSQEEDDPNPTSGHHGHGHGAGGHKHGAGGSFGFLLNVLGFDRFTRGKAADGLARAGKAANPFDIGFVSNCTDFWTKGREIGVQYESLYDVPPEGFRAAKRRRESSRDEEEEGSVGGKRGGGGAASRYIPGFLGRGRASSNPYQAINMSEDV